MTILKTENPSIDTVVPMDVRAFADSATLSERYLAIARQNTRIASGIIDRVEALTRSPLDRGVCLGLESSLLEIIRNSHDAYVSRLLREKTESRICDVIIRIKISSVRRQVCVLVADRWAGVSAADSDEKRVVWDILHGGLYYGGKGMGDAHCSLSSGGSFKRRANKHGAVTRITFGF